MIVWLAFLPRRFRIACFCLVTPFQAAIILTANYAFLNYLVLVPRRAAARRPLPPRCAAPPRRRRSAAVVAGAGRARLDPLRDHRRSRPASSHRLPRPLLWPAIALEPFRIANRYGLFAVMTTARYEIEFQGSRDGVTLDRLSVPLQAAGPDAGARASTRRTSRASSGTSGSLRSANGAGIPGCCAPSCGCWKALPASCACSRSDPFPTAAAGLGARGEVAVLVHHAGGEAGDRRLVETRGAWSLRARAASGERRASRRWAPCPEAGCEAGGCRLVSCP